MKATDSSLENCRASSMASSITTAGGHSIQTYLVNGQAENVAVHHGHAGKRQFSAFA